MRLTDVLTLAVEHGVRQHVEKRAGVMLPLAVGAMIPGIVHKAMERAHSTEEKMNRATNQPFKTAALPLQLALPLAQMGQKLGPMFGGAARAAGSAGSSVGSALGQGAKGSLGAVGGSVGGGIAQGISGGIGDSIKRMMLGREFGEKKDPYHMGAGAAVTSFGKEMGTSGANLLRDIANKAMEAVGQAGDESARQAILGDLKRTDPVLANADDKTLMEAYHTMSRFAPVLSTDKNAVRSFLRQAVMSGSGPDFVSIKLLADSERAVTGGNDKRATVDLRALLAAAAKPALAGAGAGALTGAIADKDDRGGGALRGALTGGAMGGLGGALHEQLTGTPTASTSNDSMMRAMMRGGAGTPISTQALGLNPHFGGLVSHRHEPHNEMRAGSSRWIPAGVEQTARDLSHLDPLKIMNPQGGYR